MKNYFLQVLTKLFLAAIVTLLAATAAFSQAPTPWSQNVSPLPPPTGFINDYAGVIDAATKQALETKLKNFRDTTDKHVELSVAIVKTTGDRAPADYALAVYRGWGIGSKADDNPGALLLIAIDDRKYYTEVGKDLEDELPDGVVGSLQRQYLVPEFKKGNYAKGISDTLDAYIDTIRNKGNPTVAPTKPVKDTGSSSGFSLGGIFCCAVILLVILLIIFSKSKGGPTKGDRGRWGGGGFGGGGGSSGSDIASAVLGGLIGSAISGGSSSSSSDWGSSSGGGSDWGGFGGGGDAGGGGAGGDW